MVVPSTLLSCYSKSKDNNLPNEIGLELMPTIINLMHVCDGKQL